MLNIYEMLLTTFPNEYFFKRQTSLFKKNKKILPLIKKSIHLCSCNK